VVHGAGTHFRLGRHGEHRNTALRAATSAVKHDMSLVPSDPKEPANHPLYFIMTMIFDCKKQASRMESGEAHLADGTVKEWQRKNPQEFWLKTDDDVALAFVCAWPGPQDPGKPDD
jgi:hypothetical protein